MCKQKCYIKYFRGFIMVLWNRTFGLEICLYGLVLLFNVRHLHIVSEQTDLDVHLPSSHIYWRTHLFALFALFYQYLYSFSLRGTKSSLSRKGCDCTRYIPLLSFICKAKPKRIVGNGDFVFFLLFIDGPN